MQKNLTLKAVLIIAILVAFLYGIFGIPKSFSAAGLKDSLLERIHLGLDLKGGTHLILQVKVNEAVSAETDHVEELLKEELQKVKVGNPDISKPDPVNQPQLVVVKGLSPDGITQLRRIATEKLPEYDVTGGAGGAWNVVMKPTPLADLKSRAV